MSVRQHLSDRRLRRRFRAGGGNEGHFYLSATRSMGFSLWLLATNARLTDFKRQASLSHPLTPLSLYLQDACLISFTPTQISSIQQVLKEFI